MTTVLVHDHHAIPDTPPRAFREETASAAESRRRSGTNTTNHQSVSGTVASMVVVYGGPGGFFREGDHRVGLSSS